MTLVPQASFMVQKTVIVNEILKVLLFKDGDVEKTTDTNIDLFCQKIMADASLVCNVKRKERIGHRLTLTDLYRHVIQSMCNQVFHR